MKGLFIVLLTALLGFPTYCIAEDFLGLPIVPNSKILKRNDERVEFVVKMSHDEILRFYKNFLKGYKDIRIREWKEATYIEDDGNRKWHSITISRKSDENGIKVVIKKDSWTWIISTLILRFIGVFVVLMTLFFAISISGRITAAIVKKMESKEEK